MATDIMKDFEAMFAAPSELQGVRAHARKSPARPAAPRRLVGIVKWFDPRKEGGGFGYLVASPIGFEGLEVPKGGLHELRFSSVDWKGAGGTPKERDVVVFSRSPGKGRQAVNVQPFTGVPADLTAAFAYANTPLISGMDNKGRRYNQNIVLHAWEKTLLGPDPQQGAVRLARVLSLLSPADCGRICDQAMTSDALVRRVREFFFKNPVVTKGVPPMNLEIVQAKALAGLAASMKAEQEELLEDIGWEEYQANGKTNLIGYYSPGAVEMGDVRRPDFSKPTRGLSVVLGSQVPQREGYYSFEWEFSDANPGNLCEIRPHGEFHLVEPRAIIRLLADQTLTASVPVKEKFRRQMDTIRKQLVGGASDVFVYELLQNANDYPQDGAKVDVGITLTENHLVFQHTGAAFSGANIAAICDVNAGDKTGKRDAIGYKGIGFKTVFEGTTRVHLKSGPYNFIFDKERAGRAPWELVPFSLEDAEIPADIRPAFTDGRYRVNIALRPESAEKMNKYASILQELFKDEGAVLFIPEIRSVSIRLPGCAEMTIPAQFSPFVKARQAFVGTIAKNFQDRLNAEIQKESVRVPPKYKDFKTTAVDFACRREGRRLQPVQNSHLYCYLPAKKASWGFGFLMNTDMVPNGPRDDIETGDPLTADLNQYISRIAGEKFRDWLQELLDMRCYDADTVFGLIPDFKACQAAHYGYKDYISAFQAGFETALEEKSLRVPMRGGDFVSIAQLVDDTTGVTRVFRNEIDPGWLSLEGSLPHDELQDGREFSRFLKTYGKTLGVRSYTWSALRRDCECPGSGLGGWLVDAACNRAFLSFVVGAGKLDDFGKAKVFLDNRGELGRPDAMVFPSDMIREVKARLPEMAACIRYLNPDTADVDERVRKLPFRKETWRGLLIGTFFSLENGDENRKHLGDLAVSSRFYALVAEKLDARKFSSADKNFFRDLPFVDQTGAVQTSFQSEEYSVFWQSAPELKAKWVDLAWVRILHPAYLNAPAADKIRAFLGNSGLGVVHDANVKGMFESLARKFRPRICSRMAEAGSDLDFYGFLDDHVQSRGGAGTELGKYFASFPVMDSRGRLVARSPQNICYQHSPDLEDLMARPWMKDVEVLHVLARKYLAYPRLMEALGVRTYDGEFGSFFQKTLAKLLSLGQTEDVRDFHGYMARVHGKGLLNRVQLKSLAAMPVIVADGSVRSKGVQDCYLPSETIDVASCVRDGNLRADILVLDSSLCADAVSRAYWKAVKEAIDEDAELDGKAILRENLGGYLQNQKAFMDGSMELEVFRAKHRAFLTTLAAPGHLDYLREEDAAGVSHVRVFDGAGKLEVPHDLKLASCYGPSCDFQKYWPGEAYAADTYREIDGARDLLVALGVQESFSEDDVHMLEDAGFCSYFWTVYLKENPGAWEDVRDWLSGDAPCVLDRKGEVRCPYDLYSPEIVDYVEKLPDADTKLPLTEGIDPEWVCETGVMDSLTAEDALRFLLTNPPNKMRGQVLKWLVERKSELEETMVADYRANPCALWWNGEEDAAVQGLCAIRCGAKQARRFAQSQLVMNLTGICGGTAGVTQKDVEKGLELLDVPLIDDDDLDVYPEDETDATGSVKGQLAVCLLVFLATRYQESWQETEFPRMMEALDSFSFLNARRIVVRCTACDGLESDYDRFLQDDDKVYFVGDWQDRMVWSDMADFVGREILRDEDSSDVKMALNTDGGVTGLARWIRTEHADLLKSPVFKEALRRASGAIADEVDRLGIARSASSAPRAPAALVAPVSGPVTHAGDEGRSVLVTLGEMSLGGLSGNEMHAAVMDAKRAVEHELRLQGFEFTKGLCENEYSIVDGVEKDGVEYPLVVHSYISHNREFQLNAKDWEQLARDNAMLWVYTNGRPVCLKFWDLIRGQGRVDISFDASNLEFARHAGALAGLLHYFKGFHLNFKLDVERCRSMAEVFTAPENDCSEEPKADNPEAL